MGVKLMELELILELLYSSLQPISSSNLRRAKAADWEINSE